MTADDVVIEALAPLIGTEVTVLVELRVGSDWELLTAHHGLLRGPFGGESGGDWFVGEHGALSVPQSSLERARREGATICLDFGPVRVTVRPDPSG